MAIDRRRVAYAIAALVVIVAGMTTRLPLVHWPPVMGKYAGAVLWGAMVYFIVRLCSPATQFAISAAIALALSAFVEFSQLWHPVWLDDIRRTTIGVLLLGRYFAWMDIAAYAVGVGFAVVIDRLLRKL
jgi:hypothetical protein